MGGDARMPLALIALLVVYPVTGSQEDRQRRHLAGVDGLNQGPWLKNALNGGGVSFIYLRPVFAIRRFHFKKRCQM